MSDERMELKQLLGEVLKEGEQDWQPLSPEELQAWRDGNLSEGERLDLQRRLLLDRDAIDALIGESAPPANAIPQKQREQSWAAFEKKIANSPKLADKETAPKTSTPQQGHMRFWRPRFSALAAVVFGVACLALTLQVTKLNDLYRKAIMPSSDVEIMSFEENARSGNERRLKHQTTFLRYEIPAAWRSISSWSVDILDPDGALIFTSEVEAKSGVISQNVHLRFFEKNGNYEMRFSSIENRERTYRFSQKITK